MSEQLQPGTAISEEANTSNLPYIFSHNLSLSSPDSAQGSNSPESGRDQQIQYFDPKRANSITIIVQTAYGPPIVVTMEKTNSVSMLKETIEKYCLMPRERQRIFLMNYTSGEPQRISNFLQDDQTMEDCNITTDSYLFYEAIIFVKTTSDTILEFPVTDSTTVADIKEYVRSVEGIPTDQQRLVYSGYLMKPFGNDRSPYELNMDTASCKLEVPIGGLVAVVITYKIFIKTMDAKDSITLNVCSSDDIRCRIRRHLGIYIDKSNSVLLLEGQHLKEGLTLPRQLLGSTVSENGIREGSTVLVGVAVEIFIVRPNQGKCPFRIYTTDTVLDIKQRIRLRTRIPETNVRLFYNDEIMEDHLTFIDFDIQPGSSIMLRQGLPRLSLKL